MDKFIFTAKGLEYAAKTATGSVLVFTRGKFGDGVASGDVSRLTDLVKPLGDLQISKETVTENQVTIETQFTNTVSDSATLPPFHLTEIGLFAKLQTSGGADDPKCPETLVCYAHATGSDAGDYIPSTPTEFIINWPFSVSNADNVQITVGLGAFALQSDLENEMAAREAADSALKDEFKNALADFGNSIIADITITVNSWKSQEADAQGYIYYADVTVAAAKENHFPNVALYKESQETASKAVLCSSVLANDGTLRFWAKRVPDAEIKATVALLKHSSDEAEVAGSSYTLPTATKNRLGGVKIGDNIAVKPDGTISASGKLNPSDFVTEEEINDMLDRILDTD